MPDFNCFAWGRYLFHIITGARPKALMNSIDLARAHCGKSRPALEYLIFYSDICKIGLYDVIVFAQ